MHVPTWRAWLATALRLVVAAVLAVAGALKLPDPAESVRAVRAYRLLPEAVVPAVGHALPVLELVVAVLLVLGLATRYAAGVAGLLMLAFVIGISSVWARGISIDCGCFGGGGAVAAGQTHYLPELARDAALLLASAFLAVWPTSRRSLDTWLSPTTHHEELA
ncbi:MauE/DoxX family redox-associated membrane protein [Angustibacter aerolatus]